MKSESPLFDRDSVLRNRARSADEGMFLQTLARDEIEERLKDINRRFTKPAIVTGLPGIWADLLRGANVVTDDDILGLGPKSHDLIVHALCLHWSNDPVGQLVQVRHALRPDGLFLGVMMGGQTLNELRACLAQAEAELSGGLSPRVAPMGEIRDLGALLQRAGLALPVADSLTHTVTYASAFDLMRDLRAMGETNAQTARQKTFSRRNLFFEAARIYQDRFAVSDNRVVATFEMIFLTGWAPDESQPQPLRPGSATARLADILNTTELGPDGKPVIGKKD